jgi:sortase A
MTVHGDSRGVGRFLAAAFTVVGFGCWMWVLASFWQGVLTEMRALRELEAARVELPIVPAAHAWQRLSEGDLVGRVTIPGLNVQGTVLAGTEPGTLDRAVGHIFGTALPGTGGNVALAAHRSTHFRGLRHVAPGQVVQFLTPFGEYHYEVEWTRVVDPEEVWVLEPTSAGETITLVTCFPFDFVGAAPQRFIVRGRRIESEWDITTPPDRARSVTALGSPP